MAYSRPCRGLVPGRVAGAVPRAWLAVSWPRSRHSPAPSSSWSRYTLCIVTYCLILKPLSVTIHPSVLQHTSQPSQPLLVTIHFSVLRHYTQPFMPFSHDTKFVSWHSLPAHQLAIHLTQSTPYCNTISNPLDIQMPCHDTIFHCIVTLFWAVAQINSALFFFSFFSSIFFISFQLLERLPKYIYIHFFFHSPIHPNKFRKIYFIYLSSVLLTVKPKKKKISSPHFFSFSNKPNKFIKKFSFILFFLFYTL